MFFEIIVIYISLAKKEVPDSITWRHEKFTFGKYIDIRDIKEYKGLTISVRLLMAENLFRVNIFFGILP
jgi:hypothetical protein